MYVMCVCVLNSTEKTTNLEEAIFLSATELKFRADYNSTPCGVGVVVVVGVRVHFKNGITF